MKIEAGKFYRTRNGRKVGPIIANVGNPYWPWIDDETSEHGNAWDANGKGAICTPAARPDQSLDLIAEWTDPAPDYNDGAWHAWTGGDCPVHPQSVVEVQHIGYIVHARRADAVEWDKAPFLFRVKQVFQPPKVPREWWLWLRGEVTVFHPCNHGDPRPPNFPKDETIKVREVLE